MIVRFIQNFFVGFLVSYFASIPFGYLNLIGVSFFDKTNFDLVFQYLLGVIFVELFFVYLTLIFSEKITKNKELQFVIDHFSSVFLFVISLVLFLTLFKEKSNLTPSYFSKDNSPFFTGLILSGFNLIQIPFWVGWNIYLLKNNYIKSNKKGILFYLMGTSVGTFFGMLCFILLFDKITENSNHFWIMTIKICLPLFYLFLSIKQGVKSYRKYHKNKDL